MTTDFIPFPKIPRLSRKAIITEKIDGTNASIWIDDVGDDMTADQRAQCVFADHAADGRPYWIWAASRKRFITPGKATDNFGFAGWVRDNVEELVKLGPGVHHGEWWGGKIQRGYGLTEKRFSLFNTSRWRPNWMTDDIVVDDAPPDRAPECCWVVPVLWTGEFGTYIKEAMCGNSESYHENVMDALATDGSVAAPGFMRPEGIVIYHTAANQMFKKTFEDDEAGKGV